MKKIFLVLAALLGLSLSAHADYRYNGFDEAVPTAKSFAVSKTVNGSLLGIGEFKDPSDVFFDGETVYILDNGNNRIVMLDNELSFAGEVRVQNVDLANAAGIYAENKSIYIAHRDDEKIYVADKSGNVTREISRPNSVLLGDAAFIPRKVIADQIGTVYMLSENSTQGAYMIDSENNFLGFYGRNNVLLTFKRMMDIAARRFATEEQRATMQNFIPVEFSNFDIDSEGFIYTVTSYSENPQNDEMIRKLNPMGENVLSKLSSRTWGDNKVSGEFKTSFIDIAVDASGFSYALDSYGKKIFWYDDNLNQICVFGGDGGEKGKFTSPVALEAMGDGVIVLDSAKNSLTVFEKTRFGDLTTQGRKLYNSGYFKESKDIFREIITMDPQCDYAWAALGAACFEDGDSAGAKEYFEKSKTAADKYSEVKKEIRNRWMKEHFALIFALVMLGLLLAAATAKLAAAKIKEGKINAGQ